MSGIVSIYYQDGDTLPIVLVVASPALYQPFPVEFCMSLEDAERLLTDLKQAVRRGHNATA
jgi:hypothetical protein